MLHDIAASGAGTSGCSPVHFYTFPPMSVLKHGIEALKRKYMPRVATGESVMAFSVTEPNAGTDTSRIQTRAKLKGRPLRRQRPQGLEYERSARGPHPAAGPHGWPSVSSMSAYASTWSGSSTTTPVRSWQTSPTFAPAANQSATGVGVLGDPPARAIGYLVAPPQSHALPRPRADHLDAELGVRRHARAEPRAHRPLLEHEAPWSLAVDPQTRGSLALQPPRSPNRGCRGHRRNSGERSAT